MANEASIRSELVITTGRLNYRSYPNDFRATVTGAKGPSPGAITAALAGTNVDLSQLTQPGLCRFMNLDPTNVVQVGISDGVEFYPMMELLPGEVYVMRLSRYLGQSQDEGVAGTGTYDVTAYRLHVKSLVAPCNILVEAFEV